MQTRRKASSRLLRWWRGSWIDRLCRWIGSFIREELFERKEQIFYGVVCAIVALMIKC